MGRLSKWENEPIRETRRNTTKNSRCQSGFKWVPSHYRNGRYVKGHCARIANSRPKYVPVGREKTITAGWDKGPIILKQTKVIERVDNNNDDEEKWA